MVSLPDFNVSQLRGFLPMYMGGAIGWVAEAAGSPPLGGGAGETLCVAAMPLYGKVATSFFDVGSTIFIASSPSLRLTVCSAFAACRSTSFMPLKLVGLFFSAGAG